MLQVSSCCMMLADSKRESIFQYAAARFSGGLKCGIRGPTNQCYPELSMVSLEVWLPLCDLVDVWPPRSCLKTYCCYWPNPDKVHLEHPSTIGANSSIPPYIPTSLHPYIPAAFLLLHQFQLSGLHGTSRAAPRSIVEVQKAWSQMLSRTPSPLPCGILWQGSHGILLGAPAVTL